MMMKFGVTMGRDIPAVKCATASNEQMQILCGSLLAQAIAAVRKTGTTSSGAVSAAEAEMSRFFFSRLSPRYTSEGPARNDLTLGNDMLGLPILDDATLLSNLEKRFKREVVYTYVSWHRPHLTTVRLQGVRVSERARQQARGTGRDSTRVGMGGREREGGVGGMGGERG